jgi:hypothetical protein
MKPHQERVVIERNELNEKLYKLKSFIDDRKIFENIPLEEQDRLIRQCNIMQNYLNVLDERITSFKE